MDYDALTGKGGEDTEAVLEKRKKSLVVRSRTTENRCCGRKCFVVTVLVLFLIVTFVTLPAGAFLIIHGNRKDLVGFKIGGALVVSIPIVVAIVIGLIVFFRRKSSRKLTFNRSTSQI